MEKNSRRGRSIVAWTLLVMSAIAFVLALLAYLEVQSYWDPWSAQQIELAIYGGGDQRTGDVKGASLGGYALLILWVLAVQIIALLAIAQEIRRSFGRRALALKFGFHGFALASILALTLLLAAAVISFRYYLPSEWADFGSWRLMVHYVLDSVAMAAGNDAAVVNASGACCAKELATYAATAVLLAIAGGGLLCANRSNREVENEQDR